MCTSVYVCMCARACIFSTLEEGPSLSENLSEAQPVSLSGDNDHIITRHRAQTKKDCCVLSSHSVGTETEKAERKGEK